MLGGKFIDGRDDFAVQFPIEVLGREFFCSKSGGYEHFVDAECGDAVEVFKVRNALI